MSLVSDQAAVHIELADYASVDAVGKLNIIGGGLDIISLNGPTGLTLPFTVLTTITAPPSCYDEEASVEVLLEDAVGDVVALTGMVPGGEPQIIRVGQNVTFEDPRLPNLPRKLTWARQRLVMTFASGLPLPIGQYYTWRVQIDHESRPEWTHGVHIPGPPAGPVIG